MRQSLQSDQIEAPEQVLYRLIQDYVEGMLDDSRVLYRASVVQVDQVGGQLELDPPNPRNTIKARIITDGYDANTAIDDLPNFWPMFPHHQLPVKEDEHVYVIFEDEEKRHGLWLTRIPQRLDIDSKNYVKGTKAYLANPANNASDLNVDQLVNNSPRPPPTVTPSDEFVAQDVPEFRARIGDHVIHGSNNTIIVMGTDRPGAVDDPEALVENAGTIDIVVGRVSEDMDIDNDAARVYISQNTDPDQNFGTQLLPTLQSPPAPPSPTVGVKADEIRIVARKGMKIVVAGGDLTIEGANINIGKQPDIESDQQHAVLGDLLKKLLDQVLSALLSHTHPTPSGPSGPSLDGATNWSAAQTSLPDTLSATVKVKP